MSIKCKVFPREEIEYTEEKHKLMSKKNKLKTRWRHETSNEHISRVLSKLNELTIDIINIETVNVPIYSGYSTAGGHNYKWYPEIRVWYKSLRTDHG